MSYQVENARNLFHTKLVEWYLNKQHSDVLIKTEKGSYHHYKVLLAAASAFFDDNFAGNLDGNLELELNSHHFGLLALDKIKHATKRPDVEQFYKNLNEWRLAGRYTDVDVKVEGQIFHCHRVILAAGCDYFDTMFNSNFSTSVSRTATLSDEIVSAEAFEQILRFLYEGEIDINQKNAVELLSACEFLRATTIDEVCVRRVSEELPVDDMFGVLMHAWASEKSSLVYDVVAYMAGHIEEYSHTTDFMELNFDIVRRIVDLYPWLDENPILNAIQEWVNHRPEVRLKHLETLTDLAVYEFDLTSVGIDKDRPSPSQPVLVDNSCLYVDMYNNYASNDAVRVCINNSLKYSVSFPKTSCRPMQARSVCAVNSRAYFLDFCCKIHRYSFYSCNVPDESSKTSLEPPITESFHHRICSLQKNNSIYLYDTYLCAESLFYRPPSPSGSASSLSNWSTSSSSSSDDDDDDGENYWIRGPLYSFNCELGQWNEMPKMKRELMVCSMVPCDESNTLYMIGGRNAPGASDQSSTVGYAQAYDFREKNWRKLPRTKYEYLGAACVAFEGKVYVYEKDRSKYEVYDPTAGKWLQTERNSHMTSYPHYRILPFRNHLWLFNNNDKEKYAHCVHLYSPKFDKWKHSWGLKETLKSDRRINEMPTIRDAFIV